MRASQHPQTPDMTKARHLSAGPSCDEAVSGLAEDAVHLGAAHGAEALCHATARVADSNLTVERPLLLALHAVALVALGHGSSLGRSPAVPGRPRANATRLSVNSPGS